MLNAVVHREYSCSGSIIINLYSDRLEIISLGGLVLGMTLEAAMLGASQARNEKLANLFYRMKLIEAYGTGISKIMRCYKGLHVQPRFESVEGAFRVILPNIHAQEMNVSGGLNMQNFTVEELSEAHRALLSTLQKCEQIDAAKLGKSQKTLLERRIAALKVAIALIEKEQNQKE